MSDHESEKVFSVTMMAALVAVVFSVSVRLGQLVGVLREMLEKMP